jgi:DNA-binding beta-propeller fold protein YncE
MQMTKMQRIEQADHRFPERIRQGRSAIICALAALALANATVAPASAAKPVSTGSLYVTNFANNRISLFTLGAEGKLPKTGSRAFPGEPASPNPVVVSPDGNSLYVGTAENNNFQGSVSQFTIFSEGTLALKSPPWVPTNTNSPTALALSPDGTSLYAADNTNANGEQGVVTQYTVGSGGLLTLKEPSPFAVAGAGPVTGVAVAPNGASAYASNFGGNTISQYSVGAGGLLGPITPPTVPSGAQPRGIAITPDSASLYVVDGSANAISQYSIGPGGALSPKTPATVPTGPEPYGVVVSPDGNSVYVSDSAEKGEISQYTVEPGGALTPKRPASVAAEHQPEDLVLSPDGKNLYVAETISDTVSQYRVESSGTLKPVKSAPTGDVNPRGIAFRK